MNDPTLREVVASYLEYVRATDKLAPNTLWQKQYKLDVLVAELGEKRISELRRSDLEIWFARRTTWGNTTKRSANAHIQACLRWAVDDGLIAKNPFPHMKLPMGKTRRAMTTPELRALLRATTPAFRQVLLFMRLTGARPCEVRSVRFRDIEWQNNRVVLERHKTIDATGRPRRIYLNVPALKLLAFLWRRAVNELPLIHEACGVLLQLRCLRQGKPTKRSTVEQHMKNLGISTRIEMLARQMVGIKAEGMHHLTLPGDAKMPSRAALEAGLFDQPVFTNDRGQPWGKHSLHSRWHRVRPRAGVDRSCHLYSARHMFATEAIARQLPLKAVAELLGHANTLTCEKHYIHMDQQPDFMARMAEAAGALGIPRTSAEVTHPALGAKPPPTSQQPPPAAAPPGPQPAPAQPAGPPQIVDGLAALSEMIAEKLARKGPNRV